MGSRFAVMFLVSFLTGCAFSDDYPAWPGLVTQADYCIGFSGSYANQGWRGARVGEEDTRPELHKLLFDDASGFEGVERIDMEIDEDRVLRLRALSNAGVVGQAEYSEAASTLSCDKSDSGVKISQYRGMIRGPALGYESTLVTMTKARDGSLVVKVTNFGVGLVYFILPVLPLAAQGEYWYRFFPAE